MASDNAAFSFDKIEGCHVFLQWKGTDACFDFHCECGAHLHFDGEFAYNVHCAECDTYWEMPFNLFPRKTTKAKANSCVHLKARDGEDD